MDEDEPLDKAAARELQEETSVNPKDVLLTQASARASATCTGKCAFVSAAAPREHLLYEHEAKFDTEFKSACIVIKRHCPKNLHNDIELSLQVGAFGDPGRDPRGWCVSVAYAALVPSTEMGVKAAVCLNKFSDKSCPCIFSTNSQAHSETKAVLFAAHLQHALVKCLQEDNAGKGNSVCLWMHLDSYLRKAAEAFHQHRQALFRKHGSSLLLLSTVHAG